jgi:hypothetical protein
MKPEKIIALAMRYEEVLAHMGVVPVRISIEQHFSSCSSGQILSHARYLAHGIRSIDPVHQYGKLNRHLAALQMCLSFAGFYSLRELMSHNRPDV